jgi:hypothetical protein
MLVGTIFSGTQQGLKAGSGDPKKYSAVQHFEPLLERATVKGWFQLGTDERLLIPYYSSSVSLMLDWNRFRSLLRENWNAFFGRHVE